MYEAYYGLRERPFDLTANPRFLFLSGGHREALSNLQYGIEANKGITLLLGEAGTGKTTLIRAALEQQRGSSVRSVYLSNPTLTRAEFYDYLAGGFGLSAEAAASKTIFLRELERTLDARRQKGEISALIVDEAQSLPHELLEEVRLLANLETMTTKLLPVVLTGQPELAARLNEPQLRQLKQRVALRCALPAFGLRETAAYVAKRIRIAGGDSAAVFTREAVEAIQLGSQGIARTISVICDNALINGFALQRRPVDADVIVEVCREFDLFDAGDALPAETDAAAAAAGARERESLALAGTSGHAGSSGNGGSPAHAGSSAPAGSSAAGARGTPSPGPVPAAEPLAPVDARSSMFGAPDESSEPEQEEAAPRRRRFLFF